MSVTGFTTTTKQLAAIVIDTLSVRINRSNTPTYWRLGQAAAIGYEVHAPLPLDDLTLKLTSDGVTTSIPVPVTNLVGTIPHTFTSPGEFTAVVEATSSSVVVASEKAELFVLEDPLLRNVFPVGETFYDTSTDSFVAPADKVHTFPAGDGYPSTKTVDIRAIVRYPAVANGVNTAVNTTFATYPLVLLVHGNHPATLSTGGPVESYKGFDYLARHLARQGFIAASLDMDQLNGFFPPEIPSPPTGYTIEYRAQVIIDHIKRWVAKNASDPRFMAKVDLSRIGLVGQSRGGEAVVRACELARPVGTAISGVVSISPTDFTRRVHGGRPYLVIYGAADGDVITAKGFKLFDRAARPKGQVFVYGATHNDFLEHADWVTERDVGPLSSSFILPRATVLNVARAYVSSFLQWAVLGRVEQVHFLNHGLTPWSLAVLHPTLECVKSFESANFRPVSGVPVISPPATPLAAKKSLRWTETPAPWVVYDTCFFQQETDGDLFEWSGSAAYISGSGGVSIDASPFRFVSFRAAQALVGCSALPATVSPAYSSNPAGVRKRFRVGLKDVDGTFADIDIVNLGQTLPYPYVRDDRPVPLQSPFSQGYAVHATKSAFATVHLPLWAFKLKQPNLKLEAIEQVQLLLDGTGMLAINDIEFSR